MACYTPLRAWPIGINPTGKTDYKITGRNVDHLEKINGKWMPNVDKYTYYGNVLRDYIEIPCGKCIGCRLDYSRTWANRMMLELKDHESAYFVTLTYDNDNVPVTYYADPDTGEALESLTLVKRDVQLFFKRLRKALGDTKIRYYLCGEYGSQTLRPHYHAIIYGLTLSDLIVVRKMEYGQLYTSEFLTNIWQKGMVGVTEVTWETCAYVARYVTKKLNGNLSEFYKLHNLQPEFALMSRKPGIARKYYDENKDEFYNYDEIYLKTAKKGIKFKPPRYFDCLYAIDNPEHYDKIKVRRTNLAKSLRILKLSNTDLNYYDLLSVEENKKLRQVQSLPRKEI